MIKLRRHIRFLSMELANVMAPYRCGCLLQRIGPERRHLLRLTDRPVPEIIVVVDRAFVPPPLSPG